MIEYVKGGVPPVVKVLSLNAPPDRAFAHFTDNIALWWPLATQSLSRTRARTVVFESEAGGRIYEVDDVGREREWGRVRDCERPRRIAFSWVLENPAEATEVEVTFEPDGKGGTVFRLSHRNWRETKSGAARRALYDQGWAPALASYQAGLRS